MSLFVISNVLPLNQDKIKSGVFLLLVNVNKKPPHLAVLIDGKVFSLTVKGRQLGDSIDVYFKMLQRNSIKVLFVEITYPPMDKAFGILNSINNNLLKFEKVELGLSTCMSPIKLFFYSIYDMETEKMNLIFDLLPELYTRNLVNSVYQLNLENEIINGEYAIEKYTIEDINSRIIKLNID